MPLPRRTPGPHRGVIEARFAPARPVRENVQVPQNDPQPTPSPASPEGPQQPQRAPLPGEPGFKAPLTKKQIDRANQTVKGMIISVLLTLAVVLPIIFLNPGSTKETYEKRIEPQEIAQQTVTTQGFEAVAPDFPRHYYANKAQWNAGAADGIGYWELGIVGKLDGEDHYVRMLQAKDVNASWVALATDGSTPNGQSVSVGSTTWQVRQRPGADVEKTILTTKLDGYTFILTGDSGDDAYLKKIAELVQTAQKDAEPAA
jgi:hypothetical protein